jgi:plastocyanin
MLHAVVAARTALRSLVVTAALVGASGLAACSHGSSAPSCANPVPASTVTIQDFAFDPSCASVRPDTSLTLTNQGSLAHTFTVKGTNVDVTVDSGQTQHVSLEGIAPGTYTVVCTFHPQMVGALKIG